MRSNEDSESRFSVNKLNSLLKPGLTKVREMFGPKNSLIRIVLYSRNVVASDSKWYT